jgi:hypothetical protein
VSNAPLAAATFTLLPTADSTVSSSNPTNNYGGSGSIAVSAVGLPNGEFQSLLQFDLSAAKTSFDAAFGVGQWVLAGASLQLTAANPNNPLFNPSAAGQIAASWLQNDAWTEGSGTPNAPGASGVTWNSLPSLLSGSDEVLAISSFNGATSGAATITLSPTSRFASDVTTGSLLSLRLYAPAGEMVVSGLFNSRSFGTAASRPALALEAVKVPEPATSVSALVALVVMIGVLMHSPRVARNRVLL